MNRQVVVTGVGLVSPLAEDAGSLHAAACAGRHAGIRQAEFAVNGMPSPLVAPHNGFDAKAELGRENLRPLDRTGRLAAAAARRALEDSGWTTEDLAKDEVGLVLGTMFGSMRTISGFDRRSVDAGPSYAKPMDFVNSVINAAAGQTGIRFNLRGVNATLSGDLTAGLQAIGYAADLVRSGRVETVLAGGADELCIESLYGFHKLGLLCDAEVNRPVPLSEHVTGLMPAEGAALLVLESRESAERRGATILAEILGHGSAFDASRGTDPRASVECLGASIGGAFADASLSGHEATCVSSSANGSANDALELEGIEATDQTGAMVAVKATTGEPLGAAGALQTILAIESLRRREAPGVPGLPARASRNGVSPSAKSTSVSGDIALVTALGLQGKTAALVAQVVC